MTKKIALSLLCSVAMFQSACAQENTDAKLKTVKNEVISEVVETSSEVNEAVAKAPAVSTFNAPDTAWRTPDPENTLYIDTVHGRVIVELYPEIAPKHVERIKVLARQGFYNNVKFHRVIQGFMNQTGDPIGDGTGSSSLPDLKAEFAFSRDMNTMPVKMLGGLKSKLNGNNAITGFYKALPVATAADDTLMFTKKGAINSYGIHCRGVTSMARGGHSVDSANSQFFLMRDEYRSLDTQYSIWGATIHGHDVLKKIKIGTVNDPKYPGFIPDKMLKVQIAADVPKAELMNIEVLKTDDDAFLTYTEWLKEKDGRRAKICEIQVPSRLK